MTTMSNGEITPEPVADAAPVTVSMSALVDDVCSMRYAVNPEGVSVYFGAGNDDSIHIGFTDQSVMNLARLVNQAVCAMLRARGIPVPADIGQGQSEI
ncbi:MAG TPA: hypothetical protein VFW65_13900 [Pseudonocardiaceae bacterium]|nr:hypothetical protein [Pseudonocardiaceae bacterium]